MKRSRPQLAETRTRSPHTRARAQQDRGMHAHSHRLRAHARAYAPEDPGPAGRAIRFAAYRGRHWSTEACSDFPCARTRLRARGVGRM